MASRVLLLLPPSEGKATGGTKVAGHDTFADLLRCQRDEIRGALGTALHGRTMEELSRLMRVRGALLDRACETTEALVTGMAPLLPAWRRYSGVVWEHLDPISLRPSQRARLLVPSALYGITTGQDAVADYRLTMHVSLPIVGNIAHYWRDSLTSLLAAHSARSVIVDLLPKEHGAAINMVALAGHVRVLRVDFVSANGERAVGHGAKAVKGYFARHLLDEGLGSALGFRWEGWSVARAPRGFVLVAPS